MSQPPVQTREAVKIQASIAGAIFGVLLVTLFFETFFVVTYGTPITSIAVGKEMTKHSNYEKMAKNHQQSQNGYEARIQAVAK